MLSVNRGLISRISPLGFALGTLMTLATGALADVVTLKNGEHLEGKITKESARDLTMEVVFSQGISEERVVPKATIEKVDKVSPEIVAYRAISGVRLGNDSMAVAQYDSPIGALRAFVKQYPNSGRTLDVRTILNSFVEEKKRVENGEVKSDGTWLSKAEVDRERVQIGARLAFSYMKSQSATGDYLGAMTTFTAIEKNYPGAAVWPDAIDLAGQVVGALKKTLEKEEANAKAFNAERAARLAGDSPQERAQSNIAIKQEDANAEAIVAAAEKAGNWPPLLAKNEKCVKALITRADHEKTRLAALPVDKMRQSLRCTEQAKLSLNNGDNNKAADILKQATSLWAENEMAKRLAKETADAPKSVPASPTTGNPISAK
jgi:hypothetical protein